MLCRFPIRAVARLPSFVKLDVNGNAFSENAVEAITKVLKNAKKALGGEFNQLLLSIPFY